MDSAGRGEDQPGNLVDQGRLSGAVRPDYGVQLSWLNFERHPVRYDQPAEILMQIVDFKHGVSHGSAFLGWCRQGREVRRAQTEQRAPAADRRSASTVRRCRQYFVDEKIARSADYRAMPAANPAEQNHDDQFARTLPRHIRRADELGRIGKQETGESANGAGDHVADALKAEDVKAQRCHSRRVLARAAKYAPEARIKD